MLDIPYFEDLVLHLKKSEELKKHFGDNDFFAEPNIDFSDIDEQVSSEGQKRNFIWVYPANSQRQERSPQTGCSPIVEHYFYIVIVGDCPRDKFAWIKNDSESIELSGKVIDMVKMRSAVKSEISRFNKIKSHNTNAPQGYRNIMWVSDDMIDYTRSNESCGLLKVVSKFKVDIFI